MQKNHLITYLVLALILTAALILALQDPDPAAPPPFKTLPPFTVAPSATNTATATETAEPSGTRTETTAATPTRSSRSATPAGTEERTPSPGATLASAPTASISTGTAPAATSTAEPLDETEAAAATRAAAMPAFACETNPLTAQMVDLLEPEAWMDWIEKLSGAEPVTIAGQETRITSRWTPAMFGVNGNTPLPNARAFEYVQETVLGWYPAASIEVQPFTGFGRGGERLAGKNLILTLEGQTEPDEVVLLTAHLDSMSSENPDRTAPGAEDNASGSAALLEAARLFRDMRFERTIQIVWFTGEEQGLVGSKAFLDALPDPDAIMGVVNLDMFGYDSDDDRCFELHIGTLATSDRVGQCFADSIEAYDLELDTFDYLTAGAISASDHGNFWERGIGAVEVLENMFDNDLPEGCSNSDHNEAYHTPDDTVDVLNAETGIRIVRAALATVAGMAEPLP